MRKVRNQKCICLLLAIAIMISGICLERIPADSYFSCSQSNTIVKAEGMFKNIFACRTETLSQREVLSSLRVANRPFRRNQVSTHNLLECSLFSVGFLPQNFQSKQGIEKGDVYCNTSGSVVILSYIHNQDGEKA